MRKVLEYFIFLFILIPSQIFAGVVYYIDATKGNDSNNGLSLATAWSTIAKANSELRPGDTVYIRGGTYEKPILPGVTGTEGNYITYARYQNEEVIIKNVGRAVDLRDRHYIVIDGLKILHTTKNGGWVNLGFRNQPSSYNIIKNCYMEGCTEYNGIYMHGEKSHHNKIINNALKGYCGPKTPQYGGPSDLIALKGGTHHNLIEGNYMHNASHNIVDAQDASPYNIIRNNVIINEWHTGINIFGNSHHTLIEGNIIIDCGDICDENGCAGNRCGSSSDRDLARMFHSGIQLGSTYNIIRNNVLINNGPGINISSSHDKHSVDNRIYHNTFNQNYFGFYVNSTHPVNGNIIKNNIFSNNREHEISITVMIAPRDNYFVNNNILGATIKYYPTGIQSLLYLEANYPTFWHNNVAVDAKFTNEACKDLILQASSPMIDGGMWLTTTVGSGTGTSISVADARYFIDGWGIIDGDSIQLEKQTQTARIINVDYESNIITLDTPLWWNSGQGVSLRYSGFAPDIGAYEFVQEKKRINPKR